MYISVNQIVTYVFCSFKWGASRPKIKILLKLTSRR